MQGKPIPGILGHNVGPDLPPALSPTTHPLAGSTLRFLLSLDYTKHPPPARGFNTGFLSSGMLWA